MAVARFADETIAAGVQSALGEVGIDSFLQQGTSPAGVGPVLQVELGVWLMVQSEDEKRAIRLLEEDREIFELPSDFVPPGAKPKLPSLWAMLLYLLMWIGIIYVLVRCLRW